MTDSALLMAQKFALSSTAAAIAESSTFPLDLTKIRMQTANMYTSSSTAMVRPSMVGTAYDIVTKEGILALWQGLAPAVTRHIIYSGFRMSIYEQLRYRVFYPDSNGNLPAWKSATCGLLAGALGQLIASPTDLVKIRMQTQGRDVLLGKPKRYHNMRHALITIVQQEGWRGLYKGCVPSMQRAALVGLGDIGTYDTAKRTFRTKFHMEEGVLLHLSASGCSGAAAALLSTPADVVKTRVMNQPVVNGQGTLYKNSIDCLLKTVRAEGVLSLWRGLLPIWLRMAPWSFTFWTVYEQTRKAAGLQSF